MHIHPLITDTESLEQLCERLGRIRLRRGRHRVHAREHLLAGPLPDPDRRTARRPPRSTPRPRGSTSTPLLDLLVNNEDVLKVFHAGGQDIEIIFNLTGGTPHPLFDTQIAAMALGLGEQVGYSNLVESLLGTSLDKGARFTDWARRPLDQPPDRLCDRRRHPSRRAVSARCSSGCGGPAAAHGSTRRWSGSPTPPITTTIRPWPGRGSGSRAASPTCSAG